VELHIGPEREGPGPVVLGTGPRQSELWFRLAVVAETDERLEDQAGGDIGRGVEDADLQRIEARHVELEPDRERATLLLGHRRPGAGADGRSRQDKR